jgi:hypothetical protein
MSAIAVLATNVLAATAAEIPRMVLRKFTVDSPSRPRVADSSAVEIEEGDPFPTSLAFRGVFIDSRLPCALRFELPDP